MEHRLLLERLALRIIFLEDCNYCQFTVGSSIEAALMRFVLRAPDVSAISPHVRI
jgi:hypothetical protein